MMGQKITITHVKADFDAIASAWGACKLLKCDHIIVSTEMESNVCAYLKNINTSLILKIKPKDIEKFEDIDHLVITDCKQLNRLGELRAFVHKAKTITIFDHHPSYTKDIHAQHEFIEKLGSCTTVVVKKLLESGEEITPAEATLYLLGIYEDTGMLTFSSTTTDDVRVVAALMERGGDLSVVTDYVKREFSRQQVFILNELLINMSTVSVGGVNITYSFASIDEYIEELAFLTHRMMEMEGLLVLFVMVRTGPRVVLIGRSRDSRVDVSKVVGRFGGGGHPSAASANIKDMELYEALDMLKISIRELIKPVRFVREIMTSPVRYLEIDNSFDDAMHLTLKHNLNHMPVLDKGRIAGIISRKDILQGIKHGLTSEPVSTLMQTEIQTLTPDTPFREAEEVMLSFNQKLLPVEENGRLVGVVSRTDILRLMHEEYVHRSAYEEGAKTRLGLSRVRNMTNTLRAELDPLMYQCLEDIGDIVAAEGMSAYLVGGFVRDLLMGKTSKDMDVVVEGDAVTVASLYAHSHGGKTSVHEKFKTATVTLPGGEKIDFATARTEYYCTPGAAPTVECSSLRSDLSRRDFTINAMAIRIDKEDFGRLVDYFGGQRDILDGKIRVLHSLSFIDDPTRAFRAIRFAARFDFILGSNTERLMKDADRLGLFARIPGGKMFTELKYILMEREYLTALLMLKKYNMLLFIAPKLSIDENRQSQFHLLEDLFLSYADQMDKRLRLWHVRYVVLMFDHSPASYKAFLERFGVERNIACALLTIYNRSRYGAKSLKNMKDRRPSAVYRLLKKFTDEELLMLAVALGELKNKAVLSYIKHDRQVRPILNGNDLLALGIPQSKEIGDTLEELLYERLDGKVNTRADEEAYVKNRRADKQEV